MDNDTRVDYAFQETEHTVAPRGAAGGVARRGRHPQYAVLYRDISIIPWYVVTRRSRTARTVSSSGLSTDAEVGPRSRAARLAG